MSKERIALFMCATHCQGGHSAAGAAAAEALGITFPITMKKLANRARKEGLDPKKTLAMVSDPSPQRAGGGMTRAPETEYLEPEDGLFLTDAELIRRLGVPKKIGYRAIRELEKRHPGRPKFPEYDPLFPRRRFWPAVEKYFMLRHTHNWQENFNATAQTPEAGRDRDPGPGVETSRDTLARLLDSATGPHRARVSHKKPALVASNQRSDRDS